MGKNKHNNAARPMKHPPRSASAARRMVCRPVPIVIEEQQAVSVHDLVENKILAVNGKGEVMYAGE